MPEQGRPSPGDMTGQLKAQLAKETLEAQSLERAEANVADAAQSDEERFGVFDPQTGALIEGPPDSAVAVAAQPAPQPAGFQQRERFFSGKESQEEIDAALAAQATEEVRPARHSVGSPLVRIRVDQDIDRMTYGMLNGEPNDYTFKEGMTYQVPRDLAEHLDERNMVRQWMTQ